MKLTDVVCKSAKPKEKLYKLFDGGGLYLEVTPSNGKYWKLKYRFLNKEKKLPLGEYPLITLREAREKRDIAKKQLDKNIDPMFAKEEAKRQVVLENNNTFETIAKEWHENAKEKWSAGHGENILHRLELYLFPDIGNLPIKYITPPILLQALKKVEGGVNRTTKKHGIFDTTKRLRQYCSQIFRYAIATGRAERDMSADIVGAFKHARVKHHAALDIKDLPELLDKIIHNDARLFLHTRKAIELMILTFVRTSELLEAKWSEFDFENKLWRIPAERMKMRQAHIVPLSKQSLEILKYLKDGYGQWDYVFPSQNSQRKPISENTILYALYRMGYKGKATGHGFRALAMTAIKEQLGYRHEVIDRQLAHAHRNSVDAAYDRAQFLEDRKKMMQEWADYVDALKVKKLFAA